MVLSRGADIILLILCAHAVGRELKYPTGVKPGDQISGSSGEYFRYKHVLVKPPDDEDRIEALKMSDDIKCRACEIMLDNMVKNAESLTEDHIMDQMDGDMKGEPEVAENQQEWRVNSHRKGCNKHYKDELLLKGYSVRQCPEYNVASPESGPQHCLIHDADRIPTERDVDTFSVRSEAVYYACENTISRYQQEIATHISEKIEDGVSAADAVSDACRQAARCAPAPKRMPKPEAASSKTKRRKRGRTRKAENVGEL